MSMLINPYSFGNAGGSDPYWANVVSLLHFDGNLTDERGKVWTANGNAAVSSVQAKWGSGSLLCDGNGDFLSTPANADFSLTASGDFTVEFWLWLIDKDNNDGNTVMCVGNSTGYWQIVVRDNNFRLNVRRASDGAFSDLNGPLTLVNNSWHHYAWTRASGTVRLFYDGTQLGTTGSFPTNPTQGSNAAYIGANFNGGTSSTHGYIDDVRITKGVARYTANFTPPSGPFPNS